MKENFIMAAQLITPELRNAYFSFRLAEDEFNRPNEDVVTLCACNRLRGSMTGFLRSFLKSKFVTFSDKDFADDLLKLCTIVDYQFKAIDLSCFICNHEGTTKNTSHCFSVEKMKDCFTQSRMVKNLVLAKLNISEKDFEVNLESA